MWYSICYDTANVLDVLRQVKYYLLMNTVYEQIEKICKEVGEIKNLTKSEKITVYQNKTNPTEFIKSLEEGVEKKVNLADYEKAEINSSLKSEIFHAIFGSEEFKVTTEVKNNIELFNSIAKEVTKATRARKAEGEAKPKDKEAVTSKSKK